MSFCRCISVGHGKCGRRSVFPILAPFRTIYGNIGRRFPYQLAVTINAAVVFSSCWQNIDTMSITLNRTNKVPNLRREFSYSRRHWSSPFRTAVILLLLFVLDAFLFVYCIRYDFSSLFHNTRWKIRAEK